MTLQALLDLDGTVADYQGALRRDMMKIVSPDEVEAVFDIFSIGRGRRPDWFEARRDLITRQPGWWRNLARLELGFEIVNVLQTYGFTIDVLTQGPATKPQAWAEKLEWCAEHLPDANVTITRNKALTYGRVLVDDWPGFVGPWLENRPRGLAVVPAQPWNEDFKHPNVFRYDGTNYEELRAAVMAARDRLDGEPLNV